jgi:hypothetical protein
VAWISSGPEIYLVTSRYGSSASSASVVEADGSKFSMVYDMCAHRRVLFVDFRSHQVRVFTLNAQGARFSNARAQSRY